MNLVQDRVQWQVWITADLNLRILRPYYLSLEDNALVMFV
jgi:hypothetical protein